MTASKFVSGVTYSSETELDVLERLSKQSPPTPNLLMLSTLSVSKLIESILSSSSSSSSTVGHMSLNVGFLGLGL